MAPKTKLGELPPQAFENDAPFRDGPPDEFYRPEDVKRFNDFFDSLKEQVQSIKKARGE